jgi:hypothetical protein
VWHVEGARSRWKEIVAASESLKQDEIMFCFATSFHVRILNFYRNRARLDHIIRMAERLDPSEIEGIEQDLMFDLTTAMATRDSISTDTMSAAFRACAMAWWSCILRGKLSVHDRRFIGLIALPSLDPDHGLVLNITF